MKPVGNVMKSKGLSLAYRLLKRYKIIRISNIQFKLLPVHIFDIQTYIYIPGTYFWGSPDRVVVKTLAHGSEGQ